MGQNGITWGQPTMGAAVAVPPTAATPAPATPQGTGAPIPRTGVIGDAAPGAAGLGAAVIGVLLCGVARRRR
jgi:hypothetical protein